MCITSVKFAKPNLHVRNYNTKLRFDIIINRNCAKFVELGNIQNLGDFEGKYNWFY